ncbi:MAG: DUF3473 domain-containing protein [Gammaproteobacteria bacterium]|nr:DUF3473 domain-containing protein [Gammaproteobacteria bacterium]
MTDRQIIHNAMTVDVEDYFHVAAFSKDICTERWDNMESRVKRNTHKILDIFKVNNVKATFFVLGWVADRDPDLVRCIAEQGHEIACHGYSHQLIYEQKPDVFYEETLRAKNILEDITGNPVNGYRAASYSITEKSKWALDILSDIGFTYDSSIFPVHHDRYGMPGTPKQPHTIKLSNGKSIVEFPLSTLKVFGYTLPVAGGGYFRLYPYWFTEYALKKVSHKDGSFVFYMHPWEIDPEQPRIKTNLVSRFRHYNNLDKCEARLTKLINKFEFTTMNLVLKNLQLLE